MSRNTEIKEALEKAFTILGNDPTKLYITIANDLCPGYKVLDPEGEPSGGTALAVDNSSRMGDYFDFREVAVVFTIPSVLRVVIPYKAIYGAWTDIKFKDQLNWATDPDAPDRTYMSWATAVHTSKTKH